MKNMNAELGQAIIEKLGGTGNVKSIGHCSTRLRILLNDEAKMDLEEIKKIPGVMGAVKAVGGVQVIVGNNVSKVYKEIQSMYNLKEGAKEGVQGNIFDKLLNVLSAILGPAIPAIVATGLISALLVIFTKLGMSTESNTYVILKTASNVAFYFLPVLLAYTSAKRFGCDPILAIFLGAMLLHPDLKTLFGAGKPISFIGIPVKTVDYSSTLIPIILTVWILSYVEKLADKYIPDAIKYVFKPLLIILVMLPITLCITGPAGAILGDGFAAALTFIYAKASWLALLIVAALAPFMVLTGTHLALLPLIITNFSTMGFDNLMFVAFIGMNFSQFAVSLAVFLKTKNKRLKQLSSGTAITAFLCGVTEPALYGITVRLKKPLIATWIGCIANGIYCAIFGVKVFAFGAPSFFTMPIFINPDGSNSNLMFAIGAVVLSIVVTFAATWLLGFDDSIYGEDESAASYEKVEKAVKA